MQIFAGIISLCFELRYLVSQWPAHPNYYTQILIPISMAFCLVEKLDGVFFRS
jgi:hypothetical protein